MSRRLKLARRSRRPRQRELPFVARSRRLDRVFKGVILGFTLLVLTTMIAGTSTGRRLVGRANLAARSRVRSIVGLPPDRGEFEAQRHVERLAGIETTRSALGLVARNGGPAIREFLQVAGLDRDSAVVRWGNFDWTLALSSHVFEPDDAGRSYRLKPRTRSVWLINLTIQNVLAMFEIPDTPEARRLGEAAGGRVVPESVQSTNSWGCRGPEPDLSSPLRGLVLGDSNMQGLLVGDDQTPPRRLQARLQEELGGEVSVLNAGVLGYSPEQYYFSLVAFFDRLRPHFVVVSVCANDFGDVSRPENWAETDYWLDAITQFCRTRQVYFLVVPLPTEDSMLGSRNPLLYQGKVAALLDGSGANFLDPIDEFADAQLVLRGDSTRTGKTFSSSPLFNRHLGDNHMSPLGSDLWSRLVSRRIALMHRSARTSPISTEIPDRPEPAASGVAR